MNLIDIVEMRYPGQIKQGNVFFKKPGNELVIDTWVVDGITKPREADLLKWGQDNARLVEINRLLLGASEALERLVDETATQRGFKDAVTCVSYKGSSNLLWSTQAGTFFLWRDAVWGYLYSLINNLKKNQATVPSVGEVIQGAPKIIWLDAGI